MAITLPPNLEGNTDPDVVVGFNDLIAQMNAELATIQTADVTAIQAQFAADQALTAVIIALNSEIAQKRATMTSAEAVVFYEAVLAFSQAQPVGSVTV